ncbi:hypothetical protein BGZ51_005895 [Haplosporangium sp. Z 767]|nr:hypothetical protein BGZ51_005895 [Haplosporangium sp. Z 767]KAF9180942.1 hypothetical protein BGZ50_005827 [Haplosporangium sp. Z 11]
MGNAADSDESELDDYICALMLQVSMISNDREKGQLGKAAIGSDAQVAIEHLLREAQEMEQSCRMVRSLTMCEPEPEYLFEEMDEQECIAFHDRKLVERLVRGEPSAELSLRAANARFEQVIQFFYSTTECCACISKKLTYTAPCGHAYCEECAQSLYNNVLADRSFFPVRCCKLAFAPEIITVCLDDEAAIEQYHSIKDDIENPCPPTLELDQEASKLINENGWKWRTCNCGTLPDDEVRRILNEPIVIEPEAAQQRAEDINRNYYQHDHNWNREEPKGQACTTCGWALPPYRLRCKVCMESRCSGCHSED